MSETDTIIIGGGLSGLYTALKLQELNIPYLLLEAKPSFGGRIVGQSVFPGSDLSVDLGPTWFWPHQELMIQLLAQLQVEWFEQYSIGDTLVEQHPDEIPIRIQNSTGAMTSCRVRGGLKQLITALTEQLEQTNIKRDHPVTAVRKSDDKWQVTTMFDGQERTFDANQLILAIPPRLIVKYLTPDEYMSKEFVAALQAEQTWMSGQAKFVAVYNEPFWRKNGLAGQAFSQVGPMVEIHDASSTKGSGFGLFGFIGLGPEARAQLTVEQLKSQCIEQFGSIFGPEALDAESTYLKDWAQDKWVATDQDVMESPRHSSFVVEQYKTELEALSLHLVASEFALFETGYLEGALLAADTAIKNILQRS
ncbi:MAG: monoamine oxidase [Desulforhopalus sp.]|jgi:monoamine oxidase